MEPAKWQRPSAAKVAGSAVLVCALLVGAAYFLHDDSQRFAGAPAPRSIDALGDILARCDEPPARETVDGRERHICESRADPSFTLEVVEEDGAIYSAKIAFSMHGDRMQQSRRKALGLEMFSMLAGAPTEAFIPAKDVIAIGTRRTRSEYEGRAYTTGTPANVALIFAVTPPELSPPLEN